MALVTLSELRDKVRTRGDYQNSRVFTSAVLTDFINSALSELYGILSSTDEDYYTITVNNGTQAGVPKVDLPPDFYKLRKVDRLVSGQAPVDANEYTDALYVPLKRATLGMVSHYSGRRGPPVAYRLQERQESTEIRLFVYPMPDALYYLRIYYTPMFTPLVEDDDTFDMLNGYEELPVQMALYRCYQKEERPTGEVEREIARLMERIKIEAESRDESEPPYLTDYRPWRSATEEEWPF